MITVYYDFNCSFCFRTITRALQGSKVEIKLLTIQEIGSNDELFLGVSRDELYSSMWLIDSGVPLRKKGYFAFKYLYTHLHRSRTIKLVFSIPFFSDFFGLRIYRLVANNRRLAGCDSEGCSLHFKTDPD